MVYTNATATTTELGFWGGASHAFGYLSRPGVSIGGNAGGVAIGVLAKVAPEAWTLWHSGTLHRSTQWSSLPDTTHAYVLGCERDERQRDGCESQATDG